ASRPLLCAARLRRKNPVPTPAAPLCVLTLQSASAPPTALHVRPFLLIHWPRPTPPSAAYLRADAPGRLRPTPRTGPSTHKAACAECRTLGLLPLRFLPPAPAVPPPTSTPFRTQPASLSLVTCVLLVENCHHFPCLNFWVHSTGRTLFHHNQPVSARTDFHLHRRENVT